MTTDDPLHPITPEQYTTLLPLVSDEPPGVRARAALLAAQPGTVAYADNSTQPTMAAVAYSGWDGREIFISAAERPALHALVSDCTPAPMVALAPQADAAFVALPPGGVRRLRPNDARHLASFPAWLWGAWGTPEAALRGGMIYARYLRAEIVALATIAASTERHDSLSVYTIERTRRNGFARGCATRLLAAIASERGKTPLWITRADDDAAVAFGRSLGLVEARRWTAYRLP